MGLERRQRWALECFFPGLIAKLEGLGRGEFEAKPPVFRPRGAGIGYADLRVVYALDGSEQMYLDITVQVRLCAGIPGFDPQIGAVNLSDWERTYYAIGYQKRQGDRVFACDFDKYGRHVHMRPDIKKHVAVDDVEPNTSDIDPRDFVDMVAKYRRDQVYPLRIARKRKKS